MGGTTAAARRGAGRRAARRAASRRAPCACSARPLEGEEEAREIEVGERLDERRQHVGAERLQRSTARRARRRCAAARTSILPRRGGSSSSPAVISSSAAGKGPGGSRAALADRLDQQQQREQEGVAKRSDIDAPSTTESAAGVELEHEDVVDPRARPRVQAARPQEAADGDVPTGAMCEGCREGGVSMCEGFVTSVSKRRTARGRRQLQAHRLDAVVVDVEVDDARVDDHVPHEPAEERHRHAALQPEHERLPRRELLAADEEGGARHLQVAVAERGGEGDLEPLGERLDLGGADGGGRPARRAPPPPHAG